MCDTIKYIMTNHRFGYPILTSPGCMISIQKEDGSFIMSKWLGDDTEISSTQNTELVKIYAIEYMSKGVVFKVSGRKVIQAYLANHNKSYNQKGVFIVTRAAKEEELKLCPASRRPECIDP